MARYDALAPPASRLRLIERQPPLRFGASPTRRGPTLPPVLRGLPWPGRSRHRQRFSAVGGRGLPRPATRKSPARTVGRAQGKDCRQRHHLRCLDASVDLGRRAAEPGCQSRAHRHRQSRSRRDGRGTRRLAGPDEIPDARSTPRRDVARRPSRRSGRLEVQRGRAARLPTDATGQPPRRSAGLDPRRQQRRLDLGSDDKGGAAALRRQGLPRPKTGRRDVTRPRYR